MEDAAAMNARLASSQIACRRLARRAATNFYVSFLGLSRDRFDAMCALYAFLRLSDDIADLPGQELSERHARLAVWREQLVEALEEPEAPRVESCDVFPALATAVGRFGIPSAQLHAVLDGIAMDLEPREYATYGDLVEYCDRVAGAVGCCCLSIWGFREDRALEVAAECGRALQLTNILRDVREDARMGRVYLPTEDLERFNVSRDTLGEGTISEGTRLLIEFEVARARRHYVASEELFELVDAPGRPGLRAMLTIYGELLDRIEHAGHDVFSRRIRVPGWRKIVVGLGVLLGRC